MAFLIVGQNNATRVIPFLLVLSSDHLTGATGKSPTVKISKNGAAGVTPTGAITEIDATNMPGWYQIAANATDANTLGSLALHATATACDPADYVYDVVAINRDDTVRAGLTALPNAAAAATGGLACLVAFGGVAASGASTSVTLQSPASTVLDYYKGLEVSIVGGTGIGQSRICTTSSTGRVLTVSPAWATNPDSTSVIEVRDMASPPMDSNLSVTAASVTAAVTISAASVQAIWDSQTSAATVAGSFGLLVKTDLDATVSSRLATSGYTAPLSAAATENAVWDAVRSSHTTAGSFGQGVASVQGNVTGSVASVTGNVAGSVASVTGAVGSVTGNVGGNVVGSVASVTAAVTLSASDSPTVHTGTAQAGSTSTTLALAVAASATDQLYRGMLVKITGGLGAGQARPITDYTSKVATITPAWTTTPDNTSVYTVLYDNTPALNTSLQTTAASVQGNVTGSVASVTGAVGSVTGNVGGNVVGSVASVTGAVGSVTGNVGGNVVGSVASVTGNVGGNVVGNVNGNVVGSVASVTGNVGGNLVGNVNGSVVGSVASVTGAVGSVTAGVTVTTNNDKTNYTVSTAGMNSISSNLLATTLAELAQAQPAATPAFSDAIMLLYMALRNQRTADTGAGTDSVRNNAGTVIAKATFTDAAGVFTRNKMVTGP